MTEPDWEKKDLRIGWMNINSACSNILAARINAGLVKHDDNKDAVKDLLDMIGVEFAGFQKIGNSVLPEEKVVGKSEVTKEQPAFVCERCARKGKDTKITSGIASFSMKKFGEQLCMECQKHVKKEE